MNGPASAVRGKNKTQKSTLRPQATFSFFIFFVIFFFVHFSKLFHTFKVETRPKALPTDHPINRQADKASYRDDKLRFNATKHDLNHSETEKIHFSLILTKALRTDQPTDGRTNQRTDGPTNGRTDGLL
jgi:hypothetical protein